MNMPYGGQPPGSYPQQQYGTPQPGYGQQLQPGYGPPAGGYPQQLGGYPQGVPGGYPAPYGGPVAPQGAQFPPPPPGMGRLLVDTSYFPLAFILGLTGPTIAINGQPRPMRWGQVPIDLPPGQYHLHVHTRYITDLGPAEAVLPVTEGQTTPVFYRAPAVMFVKGALGPVPQKTPGMAATWIIFGVAALMVFLSTLSLALA